MTKLSLTLFALLMALTASAYDFQVNGVYYNYIGNDSVEVTKGSSKYSGTVTIPASVSYNGQTYTPTRIGADAFNGCSITSLTIKDGTKIQKIGNRAFLKTKFSKTRPFVMPDGLQTIGDSAFYGATGLQTVTLGDELTAVGKMAFAYSEMTSLKIGKNLNFTGIQFAACFPTTSVELDDENQYLSLSEGVVYNKEHTILIKSFNRNETGIIGSFPELVTIGEYAFYGDETLRVVDIPEGVTRIEERAFEHCETVSYILFPTTMKNVAKMALNCYLGYSGYNTTNKINHSWPPVYYIFKSESAPSFVGKQYSSTPMGACFIPTTTKTKYITLYTRAFGNYYLINFRPGSSLLPLPPTPTFELEDVNQDGMVNSLDVLKVYKYMQSH